jgi:transcriptional regulator with XRE-family HTH domain
MARDTIRHFPQRLQELREQAGQSREQLAVNSGISIYMLLKLESGDRAPTFAAAVKLAKALGCTLDELAETPGEGTAKRGQGRPSKANRKKG